MERITPRNALGSGLATAAGFLTKWLPAVIAPWFVAAYLQARRWRELAIFAASGIVLTLIVMLPFYLANSEAFWYPYKFQGGRKLIGESFWFLVQYHFFDPSHSIPEKPWGEPASVILGNNKLLVAQLGLVAAVFGLSLWRLWNSKRDSHLYAQWAAAGLVAVAVFTLGNRIFSPQYLVLLVWVWAMALLLRPVSRVGLISAFGLMIVTAGANFLVFLLGVWPEEWVKYSLILFTAGWGLSGWLLFRAIADKEIKKGSPQRLP
jgi:4-amino-4-deoxy-L-arabinose transferase-like glycosyltransferase